MRRVISAFLVLLFLLSAVSCANQGTDTGKITENAGSTSQEEITEDLSFTDELPELNYNGKTVRMLAAGQVGARDELYTEGLNNELINDAVYERNRMVEGRLGVALEVVTKAVNDSYYVAGVIHKMVLSGLDEYQVCNGPSYVTVQNVVKGDYLNLPSLEYLDLSKHYWSQGYNDMASWGDGHQFTASGSIALSLFRYMYVTLYNKDMMLEWQMTDPYEAVQNGEWTIDFQNNLTKDMYTDLNGDGKRDEKDFYGFISGSMTSSDCYWISCEATVLKKDENGYIVYDADVDRIHDTVERVLNLYNRDSSYIFSDAGHDSTFNNDIIEAFADTKAFMVTTMITKLEVSLRDFKGEYGILPIPKFDRLQERYHTCVQDQVSGFSVPATVPESEQEMVGATLECLASESYKTVVDAYYNTALSYKYLNNPESKIMLDLIYDCVSFEIAQIYTAIVGDYLGQMRSIVTSRRNTTTSTYQRLESRMVKEVEKLNKAYEKVVQGS